MPTSLLCLSILSLLVLLGLPQASALFASSPVKLYTHPKTRSALVAWYLTELNVPFEEQYVAVEKQEQKSADFLALNPFGQLPVLQTKEGKTIFESGAILLYLSETYGELKGKSATDRADMAQWIFFANASLSNKVLQGAGRSGSPGWKIAMASSLNALEQQLGKSTTGYLLGTADVTAADIAVASLLLYTPVFHEGEYSLLKGYPNVVDYMELMATRPAYAQAYGQDRLSIVQDGLEGYRNPLKPRPRKKGGGWKLF